MSRRSQKVERVNGLTEAKEGPGVKNKLHTHTGRVIRKCLLYTYTHGQIQKEVLAVYTYTWTEPERRTYCIHMYGQNQKEKLTIYTRMDRVRKKSLL